MKAININWDTDGDIELRKTLPSEIEIPDELTNGICEDDFDWEIITSYLSDETGYCVWGYEISEE